MAYAEQAYIGTERATPSQPVVKDRIVRTRDNLLDLRTSLFHTLGRLRGNDMPPTAGNGAQPIDPDHTVFFAEQIVILSSECQKLIGEIADYI